MPVLLLIVLLPAVRHGGRPLLGPPAPRPARAGSGPAWSSLVILPLLLLGAVARLRARARRSKHGSSAATSSSGSSAALGLVYDQRNCLVVGLAMGFAVIPIIFTIAEDAFSSVPPHLTAASLALGASRWQTATRVVLPDREPRASSRRS